jgi:hypothetical protein
VLELTAGTIPHPAGFVNAPKMRGLKNVGDLTGMVLLIEAKELSSNAEKMLLSAQHNRVNGVLV